MCIRELIINIIELEALIGRKVEPSLLKSILENCPIDYDLPVLIEIPQVPPSGTQCEKDLN